MVLHCQQTEPWLNLIWTKTSSFSETKFWLFTGSLNKKPMGLQGKYGGKDKLKRLHAMFSKMITFWRINAITLSKKLTLGEKQTDFCVTTNFPTTFNFTHLI